MPDEQTEILDSQSDAAAYPSDSVAGPGIAKSSLRLS